MKKPIRALALLSLAYLVASPPAFAGLTRYAIGPDIDSTGLVRNYLREISGSGPFARLCPCVGIEADIVVDLAAPSTARGYLHGTSVRGDGRGHWRIAVTGIGPAGRSPGSARMLLLLLAFHVAHDGQTPSGGIADLADAAFNGARAHARVPEPGPLVLLTLGCVALIVMRRVRAS